jgi:rSAM/selenodomain-associated transferase 2
MPRLSFVLPVLEEEARIGTLLRQLRRDFPKAELIVVDGGSRDRSVARALRGADAVLVGAAGRAAQMNLGAAVAQGDYLCFLHADTQPEFRGEDLLAALGDDTAWAFCRVHLAGRPPSLALISWFMNRRARLTRVATGDQLLIVRRELFEALDGFADLPLMEDVEICKRLRGRAPPRCLALRVTSSGRRWERDGVGVTVLRMWALRLAYWLGIPPQRLWEHYYGARAPRAARLRQ